MNLSEFLAKLGYTSYGTVANSWDAFSESGSVLMQLWHSPGQRIRAHTIPGAYLRVCCFNKLHYEANSQRQTVGYAGRLKAIKAIEGGAAGYAAISAPPTDRHGPGVWAKYANLERVYPILSVEHSPDGDVYAILGTPISAHLAK